MADDPSGPERQQRIQDTQHRPEQNRGYDEAVRGGQDAGHADPRDEATVGTDVSTITHEEDDPFDREAREAARDVRRREHSSG